MVAASVRLTSAPGGACLRGARTERPECQVDTVDRRRNSNEASLRIAIVAPPWFEMPPPGYGGIERVCHNLAEGLMDRGHEVILIGAGQAKTRARFIPILAETPPGLGEAEGPGQEVRYGARVARVLEALDVDVVHDHSLAGPLAGCTRTTPTVLTVHGVLHEWAADYYRALRLPLIAISDAQRRAAPQLPWTATVHNAIDVDRYPFRDSKHDYALFLGRMSPGKGAHLAPAAARAAGVQLRIAAKCREPEELRYFHEQVEPELGPESCWLGEVDRDERDQLLARARCLLLPLLWDEPFGMVLIEALACGTPVVCLRRGAAPEIVVHGRTGWLADHPDELPDLIRRAPELAPRSCREDAERRFHLPAFVEQHEDVYSRLVGAAAHR
jgi:glycosyltransferase involved in cell wall biosynthesis